MRKISLFLLLSLFTIESITAQSVATHVLDGFNYGKQEAPVGDEWESPSNLALNKEQPKAYFFSFENVDAARQVLPENSQYWMSLNGSWDFNWAKDPDSRPVDFYKRAFNSESWDKVEVPMNWNIYGLQKDGSQKYGTPIYVNQPVIFKHTVAVDDWKGGVMRTPNENWTTFNARNEVGSYRRSFTVPNSWDGREVFIDFDGVDSFFYIWINGEYVGFSKNSRNVASFNITPYITKGENVVAVEVYRNSDGSFLEAQDMFRLPGIFRTVAIHSTPKVQIRDLAAIPNLDASYTDGELNISADIRNLSSKAVKGYSVKYTLYANELYSDENSLVEGVSATATIEDIIAGSAVVADATLKVSNPNKWSAEHPYRYTLIAELQDKKGKTVETISTYVGFREVEIKDTKAEDDEFGLAGRYFYVNGETVKLKGVNRHESNPATGHYISRERMYDEVMLMKRGNINHVRNSHYPDAPYWYYLCDKYGIYLEDEANIESHEYYYGEASLSHPKEWEAAHVARVMEMTHATINAPSIVIWSLGNEAGPGDNFVTAYNELKKVDTSRPVQYERNNNIVDMGSNQYPSIGWMQGAVQGKYNLKYPFHVSEYAHSMGNACGNLDDYWEAIESTNFFCGGAIWDWLDQAMYNYDSKTGDKYLGYGGNFGDIPNDGQFVMNGIIFADMEPKPQYYEVKKVYQHIDVEAINVVTGEYEIFNKYYFKNLSDYRVKWALYAEGSEVESGFITPGNIEPRSRKTITLPYNFDALESGKEYFVKVSFILEENTPWADAGFTQAEEQMLVKAASKRPSIAEVAKGGAVKVSDNGSMKSIAGDNFNVIFDLEKGTIHSLNYDGEIVIEEGNGPKLNAFRAYTNNDNWFFSQWFENGLHNLQDRVTANDSFVDNDGNIIITMTVVSQAPNGARLKTGGYSGSSGIHTIEEFTDRPFGDDDFKFTTNQVWTIYKDGSIELQANITSNKSSLALPRIGYQVKLPNRFGDFTYYGRGPIGNYNDRMSGQFIETFKSTVTEQFENFPKPQDIANHEDVRWASLTAKNGKGAIFVAGDELSVSALHYSALDLLMATHPYKLPEADDIYLTLDSGVTGLGGNSCGQGGPLTEDRIFAGENNLSFIIRPTSSVDKLSSAANVSTAGMMPISITRTRGGIVGISTAADNSSILYTIDGGKEIEYTEPFNLRKGGKVIAWDSKAPLIKSSAIFSEITTIQTEVIFASSEEIGEGSAKHLTDGDPSTIWHTMYSVTVAKHPHWVDLDAGEVKSIKGMNFLPRTDGSNGHIREYTIHISMDGKDWGEPVHKGTFDASSKEKSITFASPIKGRYIRFTALSSFGRQDYASGAEIEVIAD